MMDSYCIYIFDIIKNRIQPNLVGYELSILFNSRCNNSEPKEYNCFHINQILTKIIPTIQMFERNEDNIAEIISYSLDRGEYSNYYKTDYNKRNIIPVKMIEELEDGITLYELTDEE